MTTATSPYTPPLATAGDVDGSPGGGTQPVPLFTYKGRIGRLRYTAYLAVIYFVAIGFGALATMVGLVTHLPEIGDVATGLLMFAVTIYSVFLTIQRSHDMDWTGWSWLWTLVPFAIFVWLLRSGSKGPNRFGRPNPPNTLGVHLVAWVLPLVLFVGLVAAVAVPVYDGVLQHAKEAQSQRR